jgi:predicted nucleic acid-binding protein
MTLVIVDTDILIDSALEVDEAIQCLDTLEENYTLAISVVTQMELMVGCRNKTELRKVEQFLERFQVITINEQVSQRAVGLLKKYLLSHGLLSADALIAATAIEYDLEFITKNQRDYRFIAGLNLLDYPIK